MPRVKTYLLALLALALIACAAPIDDKAAMEKYQFPELESVTSIRNWQLDGWQVVDERSLIIQTSPSQYYLFVLARRNLQLKFAEGILVSSTSGQVQVNFDTVATSREPMLKTPIAAMYKLKGRDQVAEIKGRIVGGE